ncbi:exported protein of unknown function [uncultured Sphingopyxis sp.]|uniref:Uncharacterized protein n=1 Tax=uncultured Sphingopyxis sp. TaxID=310581 RepID=A0A1Y5PPF1_9SPHN|nr:exported protein of unknown function [uncultured Sphingopyxis sp.]
MRAVSMTPVLFLLTLRGWSPAAMKETNNGSYRLCERHHRKRLRWPAQDALDPRQHRDQPQSRQGQ